MSVSLAYNVLRLTTALHGGLVVSGCKLDPPELQLAIEGVQVEALDGTRCPETKVGRVSAIRCGHTRAHVVAKPGTGTVCQSPAHFLAYRRKRPALSVKVRSSTHRKALHAARPHSAIRVRNVLHATVETDRIGDIETGDLV